MSCFFCKFKPTYSFRINATCPPYPGLAGLKNPLLLLFSLSLVTPTVIYFCHHVLIRVIHPAVYVCNPFSFQLRTCVKPGLHIQSIKRSWVGTNHRMTSSNEFGRDKGMVHSWMSATRINHLVGFHLWTAYPHLEISRVNIVLRSLSSRTTFTTNTWRHMILGMPQFLDC